jgi:hypothetical protein
MSTPPRADYDWLNVNYLTSTTVTGGYAPCEASF